MRMRIDLWLLIEQPDQRITMNFKKMSRRVLIAFGIVASASSAMAQSTATTNGTATATIVRPITLTASRDLAFGNVVPGATTGTMVLTAASSTVASVTGGVTKPGTQVGTVTSAQFDVGGEGGFTYSITLPASAATITSAASDTMTVDTFTSSIVVTAGALSGSIGSAGTQTFYVGGTLHVAANQNPGDYTGTFAVTVAYN
jgi:hypothetical protein